MKRLVTLAAIVLGSGVVFAAEPATRSATTAPAHVDIHALIQKLASQDYAEREEAAGALSAAYAEQGAEIEAASKRADLDPQAVMELQEIVAVQKPRAAAYARQRRIGEEDVRANRGAALADYEKVGRHNPAWDATARALITTFTLVPGERDAYWEHVRTMTRQREALAAAKCDDPLVLYFMARAHGAEPSADMAAVVKDLKAATDALERSGYSAERKCWAHARYAEAVLKAGLWVRLHDWRQELGRELERALAAWPATVQSPGMTDSMAYNLAEVLEYDWGMVKGDGARRAADHGALHEFLIPAWRAAMPKAVGPVIFSGHLYIQWAWDARGGGYANTVTDDGWRKMEERLKVARTTLEKAYAMDPADPRGPTEMLTVELGAGQDRNAMELWWQRAMDANPDNYAACTSKLYYLEPKWHGSPGEMLGFGRECLRRANWVGRIPFILVDAHASLAQYSRDKEEYYAQPYVWQDLRSVYEPYLARYPNSTWDRSYFAYYATQCGQWDEARKQFDALGDNPELKPFGTKEVYDYLRQRAKAKAAKKP